MKDRNNLTTIRSSVCQQSKLAEVVDRTVFQFNILNFCSVNIFEFRGRLTPLFGTIHIPFAFKNVDDTIVGSFIDGYEKTSPSFRKFKNLVQTERKIYDKFRCILR